jgi:glucokinase
VTIGTGISCSLVLDGKPYVGAHGNTGTLATGSLTTVCSECRGLSTSVLERIAAGPAIVTRYRNRGEDKVERCESVLAAAEQGDAIALEVIYQAAESLGSAIALMIDVLDPHAVVIGGGLGSAAGLFWESLHAATRRHIWCDAHRQLPIVQAAYGPTSALVGAALLALGE